MARHDYRDPTTGRFGKPGSALPYGSKDFPRITEETSIRKGKATQDFLAPHPSNPDLKLIAQNRDKGDDTDATETLVYEKVPGPAVVSMGYDERGDLETTITQTVLNNDDPPVEVMGYLFNSAEKIGIDMLRATSTIKTVTKRTPLWSEEAFSTNRPLMRHITGTPRTTYSNIVPVGTTADTGFLVVESSVSDKNAWEAEKKTTRVDGFVKLVSPEINPQAHGALTITTERIIPSGARASGAITLTANPANGDTVTINDQVNPAVVFAFAAVATAGHVTIGAEKEDTAAALADAISLATPLDVLAADDGAVITVTSNGVGAAGNAVTLAKTGTAITLSGGTLTGGVSATPVPGGLNIIKSSVEDLDGTHALQTTIELAPGETYPTITSTRMDHQMNVAVSTARTIVAAGSVTPGYAILPAVTVNGVTSGPWHQTTEEQEIDKFRSYKVVTTIPQSPYNSFANGVKGQTWDAASYPARLMSTFDFSQETDSGNVTTSNTVNQVVVTPRAEVVPANTYRWYLIQTGEPTVDCYEWILPPQLYLSSQTSTQSSSRFGTSVRQSIGEFLSDASTPTMAQYMGYSLVNATFTLTQYSTTVTGVGSHFTADFTVGQKLSSFNGSIQVTINAVNASASQLTLNAGWTGPTMSVVVGGVVTVQLLAAFVYGSTTAVLSMSDNSTVASHGSDVGFAWPVVGTTYINIGQRNAVVASIQSDTVLTLVEPWYGSTNTANFNSKVPGTAPAILGTEQIRRAKVEQLQPGLWVCEAITNVMR